MNTLIYWLARGVIAVNPGAACASSARLGRAGATGLFFSPHATAA